MAQTVWAGEPAVLEVQREALRYAGYDRADISEWGHRARWAAALPRLQVGFNRDVRDTVSLTTKDSVSITGGTVLVGPGENNFDDNVRQGTSVEVRAVWVLNELVFNRDTLDVSSEQRRWHQDQQRLLAEVNKNYYDRLEILRELQKRDVKAEDKSKLKIQLAKTVATLDALTGGWFSQGIGGQP